mmetsp:Transcript_28250/g.40451  ORF Transcript_28250/g.40451 Transcript_28250/m.40451 type:complete len:175 (+) Transcript_28250:58-582(+)
MSSTKSHKSFSPSQSSFKTLLGFVAGSIFGALVQKSMSTTTLNRQPANYASKGMVASLKDIPHRPTSHVDTDGNPITKQQFLEPFVVPRFVGYSVATFKAGQTMLPVHEHKSMHEFFYVLEGSGFFRVNDVDYEVSPGTFLHMAPGDKHGIWVPKENTKGDLKVAVCGITLDDK